MADRNLDSRGPGLPVRPFSASEKSYSDFSCWLCLRKRLEEAEDLVLMGPGHQTSPSPSVSEDLVIMSPSHLTSPSPSVSFFPIS